MRAFFDGLENVKAQTNLTGSAIALSQDVAPLETAGNRKTSQGRFIPAVSFSFLNIVKPSFKINSFSALFTIISRDRTGEGKLDKTESRPLPTLCGEGFASPDRRPLPFSPVDCLGALLSVRADFEAVMRALGRFSKSVIPINPATASLSGMGGPTRKGGTWALSTLMIPHALRHRSVNVDERGAWSFAVRMVTSLALAGASLLAVWRRGVEDIKRTLPPIRTAIFFTFPYVLFIAILSRFFDITTSLVKVHGFVSGKVFGYTFPLPIFFEFQTGKFSLSSGKFSGITVGGAI